MKRLGLISAAVAAFAMEQPVQAQSLDGLLSLGSKASAVLNAKVPGMDRMGKSTSNSPNDPVFGKARVKARAHPKYPSEDWPDKMIEGYIARDRYGCPALFVGDRHNFVYSFDKFEEEVNGQWVNLDIMKLAKEVPQHCTL